ncbi:hypothetical protein ABC974_08765 [Sphingomonas oligophenolica]|uniref:Cytochrome c domain-containing protein n=1 Tax=Sphingomonas oligophenolica TaxID=301154 RepID=A0ABU9Y1Q2_9SPHN
MDVRLPLLFPPLPAILGNEQGRFVANVNGAGARQPSDGVKQALDDCFPDRPEEKAKTDPPAYDVNNLGLSVSQPGWHGARTTTGCDQRNSGNSHCGHNFGTSLTPDRKLALLEYLKKL